MRAIDYTGKKYNFLTFIEFTGKYYTCNAKKYKKAKKIWLLQCDCGRTIERASYDVTAGHQKSCGECGKFSKYKGKESSAYQFWYKNYHDGDLTLDDFLFLSQQDCHWCGNFRPLLHLGKSRKPEHAFSGQGLDRIDNARGHDRDNVLPCCWPCNKMRRERTVKDFLEDVQAIYNNRLRAA